jgi:hypothetical protein
MVRSLAGRFYFITRRFHKSQERHGLKDATPHEWRRMVALRGGAVNR